MVARASLLAFLVVPVVACTPAPYTVTQHGLISMPRPASYDGQPLPTGTRLEGHATIAHIENPGTVSESGAAVAQHQAGGALRTPINRDADIGVEIDGSWAATASTLSGDDSVSVGVPDAPVIDAALAFRTSSPVSDRLRVGFAIAIGLSSTPIHRGDSDGPTYDRDEALLARAALVPSYRFDGVTVYGSIGGATQADIQETFTVVPDNSSSNDPGVVSEAKAIVLTVAAGATMNLGDRTHLTAQIADVIGKDANFGPQLMAGIAFDLGALVAH